MTGTKIVCACLVVFAALLIGPEWLQRDHAQLSESIMPFATMESAGHGDVCWAEVIVAHDGSGWVRRGAVCRKERESPFVTSKIRKLQRRFERARFVILELGTVLPPTEKRSYYENDKVGWYQVFYELGS